METGIVTLEEGVQAPAVVCAGVDGSRVLLWVFLPTGIIQYTAERGSVPGVGIFVAD